MEHKSTPNITPEETELLLQIIKKYKDIIECKETNSIKNRLKASTWLLVEQEFNQATALGSFQSHIVWKNKYNNLKKRTNCKFAEEKVKITKTGGGPSTKPELFDETDHTIVEIVGQTRLTGNSSQFDDDKQAPMKADESNLSNFMIEDIDDLDVFMDNLVILEENSTKNVIMESKASLQDSSVVENSGHNWSGNTTPLLTMRKRACLQQNKNTDEESDSPITKKKKIYKDKVTAWASRKVALNAMQAAAFEEEHKVKLNIMQTECEQQMKQDDWIAELQLNIMKTEHEQRMKRKDRIAELHAKELEAKIEFWKTKTEKEKI